MIKSFKFLSLWLIFVFVVSCGADSTSGDKTPTAEDTFAASFKNELVITTDKKVYFLSSDDAKYIIASAGRFNIDSVYEGNAGNTVARFKHSDGNYIKYIFDSANALVNIKTATSAEAEGETGTEVANAKVAVDSDMTGIVGAFGTAAAGDITAVAGQAGVSTATHFATLADDGSITTETSADDVKEILEHIWGPEVGGNKKITLSGDKFNLAIDSDKIVVEAVYNTSGSSADDIPAGTVVTCLDYFTPKTVGLIIAPSADDAEGKNTVGATIE